jgi:hypothetical protein
MFCRLRIEIFDRSPIGLRPSLSLGVKHLSVVAATVTHHTLKETQ